MACDCKVEFHRGAETVLADGRIHTQWNCLRCGAGWATDAKPVPPGPELPANKSEALGAGQNK